MNGSKLKDLVGVIIQDSRYEEVTVFYEWMEDNVIFHNTMVDRITSKRDNEPNVPKAEPIPSKSLVIEDLNKQLPSVFEKLGNFGVNIFNTNFLNFS